MCLGEGIKVLKIYMVGHGHVRNLGVQAPQAAGSLGGEAKIWDCKYLSSKHSTACVDLKLRVLGSASDLRNQNLPFNKMPG